eukprot:1089972-Pyramimonas_sp.AAC.1
MYCICTASAIGDLYPVGCSLRKRTSDSGTDNRKFLKRSSHDLAPALGRLCCISPLPSCQPPPPAADFPTVVYRRNTCRPGDMLIPDT